MISFYDSLSEELRELANDTNLTEPCQQTRQEEKQTLLDQFNTESGVNYRRFWLGYHLHELFEQQLLIDIPPSSFTKEMISKLMSFQLENPHASPFDIANFNFNGQLNTLNLSLIRTNLKQASDFIEPNTLSFLKFSVNKSTLHMRPVYEMPQHLRPLYNKIEKLRSNLLTSKQQVGNEDPIIAQLRQLGCSKIADKLVKIALSNLNDHNPEEMQASCESIVTALNETPEDKRSSTCASILEKYIDNWEMNSLVNGVSEMRHGDTHERFSERLSSLVNLMSSRMEPAIKELSAIDERMKNLLEGGADSIEARVARSTQQREDATETEEYETSRVGSKRKRM